jgi:hypothetical protein
MTTTDTRATYTQGLRALADLLDNNLDVPLPHGRVVTFFVHDDLTEALAIRDLMVDPVTSRDTSVTFPVNIDGKLAGLTAHVYVSAAASGVAPEAPRPPCDPRLGIDGLVSVA